LFNLGFISCDECNYNCNQNGINKNELIIYSLYLYCYLECYRFIRFDMSDDVTQSINEKHNKIIKQEKGINNTHLT
jgi:hypothetical protein